MNSSKSIDMVLGKGISEVWSTHEAELRAFLRGRVHEQSEAEDLLQEVFMRGLAQGPGFSELQNPRAWLFRVARNLLIDWARRSRSRGIQTDLDDGLPEPEDDRDPLTALDVCLATALASLDEVDRGLIECCDLQGMTQANYAQQNDLSLSATKSRLLRARKRLKQELNRRCGVRYDEAGNVCCFTGCDKS